MEKVRLALSCDDVEDGVEGGEVTAGERLPTFIANVDKRVANNWTREESDTDAKATPRRTLLQEKPKVGCPFSM